MPSKTGEGKVVLRLGAPLQKLFFYTKPENSTISAYVSDAIAHYREAIVNGCSADLKAVEERAVSKSILALSLDRQTDIIDFFLSNEDMEFIEAQRREYKEEHGMVRLPRTSWLLKAIIKFYCLHRAGVKSTAFALQVEEDVRLQVLASCRTLVDSAWEMLSSDEPSLPKERFYLAVIKACGSKEMLVSLTDDVRGWLEESSKTK